MIIKFERQAQVELFRNFLEEHLALGHKYMIIKDKMVVASFNTFSQAQSHALLFGGAIAHINDITYGVSTKC